MDAITLLKDDHKKVRGLFRKFEAAADDAHDLKGRLMRQAIDLLTAHTYIENEGMYPVIRELLPDLEKDILESFEEHHVADILCAELWTMDAADEHFDAKASVLIENVTHHIDEEETGWFPQVREALEDGAVGPPEPVRVLPPRFRGLTGNRSQDARADPRDAHAGA